jgi:hypothetical protein
VFELMVDVMVWVGSYVELNMARGESDMNLLYVTQTNLDLVTLAIVEFGSVGCGSSTISCFERKNIVQLFPQSDFSRYGSFDFHP